jgi:hypothetical protein
VSAGKKASVAAPSDTRLTEIRVLLEKARDNIIDGHGTGSGPEEVLFGLGYLNTALYELKALEAATVEP